MALPQGFVYLADIDPTILQDIKYATADNLMGRPLAGYLKPIAITTEPVALALATIQQQVKSQNLSLIVYEAYRPQRAAKDMHDWSQDLTDQKNKQTYYPNVNKVNFYALGYILEYSLHTRGAAVDVSLVDVSTGKALDMGTGFDFMDDLSHPANKAVGEVAYKNRQMLRELMQAHGFNGIKTEWWHFNFINELFPNSYFDFVVE